MSNVKEVECSCKNCASMCKNVPCWGTPEEAEAIINAGHTDKLMIDYWVSSPDIYMIQPAIVGFGGKEAPYHKEGTCAFLQNNLCTLHDSKLKPIEGRAAHCSTKLKENNISKEAYHVQMRTLRKEIAEAWDTDKGREIVDKFKGGV